MESGAHCDAQMHLRRAQEHDLESLAWLVERFTPPLLASANRRLGIGRDWGAEPEDLVQDVWTVFLGRLASLDAASGHAAPTIMKFLSQTLDYGFLNLVRKGRAKPSVGPHGPAGDAAAWGALSAHTSGIISKLARSERQSELERTLAALSMRDQEVLQLRGLDQLSNGEVAEVLGIPPKTVVARYARALSRLRKELPSSVYASLWVAEAAAGGLQEEV